MDAIMVIAKREGGAITYTLWEATIDTSVKKSCKAVKSDSGLQVFFFYFYALAKALKLEKATRLL